VEIRRDVTLDADLDHVWAQLIDEEARRHWLDDDRPIALLAAEPGRALTWRWLDPDRHGVRSVVTIELEEVDATRTRLVVTERAAGPPSTLGAAVLDAGAWERRLVGLELRCMARCVAPAALV
jgi:uncharacterized protein YndB with AHSA1/START domain